MAKLKGILKIQGTLDELTFYKSGSDYLVRTKGGVDGQRIANDPNFQRTRENGSEFGRAASSGKLLRIALRNLMTNAKDKLVTSRLTKVMTQVKSLDTTSARGSRNVATGLQANGGKELLKGFNFNINSIFSSIFFAPFTLNPETGALSITNLVPINDVIPPKGATHMAIKTGWSKIDFDTGAFDTKISSAETMPINGSTNDITLTVDPPSGDTGVNVHLMHIEFFQEVNGTLYALKNGAYNSLSILEIN